MEAGRLNERVTILKFVPEKSDTNQRKKGTYAPAFTVWAEVKCTQSTVQNESGAILYETVYRFNIRKRTDIRASQMRLRWRYRGFYGTGAAIGWENAWGGVTLLAKEVT